MFPPSPLTKTHCHLLQWLLEEGVLPLVVAQLSDSNALARVAAFTAVSCLVRRFPAGRAALLEVPPTPPSPPAHLPFLPSTRSHFSPATPVSAAFHRPARCPGPHVVIALRGLQLAGCTHISRSVAASGARDHSSPWRCTPPSILAHEALRTRPSLQRLPDTSPAFCFTLQPPIATVMQRLAGCC